MRLRRATTYKRSNAAFCCKGSNKLAVNGAVRSTAQLHSVPHCLCLQQRSLDSGPRGGNGAADGLEVDGLGGRDVNDGADSDGGKRCELVKLCAEDRR